MLLVCIVFSMSARALTKRHSKRCFHPRFSVKVGSSSRKFQANDYVSMDIAKLAAVQLQKSSSKVLAQFELKKGKDMG